MEFNYVNTNDNPTDLITRVVSLDKFKAQFLFVLHGPTRLVLNNAVVIFLVGFASAAMVELERFLPLAKLLRVVTYVFRFVFCLKKVSSDPSLAAKLYLLKVEQSLCFTKEKLFLLNPSNSNIPLLDASHNPFLDEEGLIHS